MSCRYSGTVERNHTNVYKGDGQGMKSACVCTGSCIVSFSFEISLHKIARACRVVCSLAQIQKKDLRLRAILVFIAMSHRDGISLSGDHGRSGRTPSLLFSIEVRDLVWGVGILESFRDEKQTASLDLHPPQNQHDSTLPLPQATCEIRGKLLLGVEWNKSGAKIELHSIRSLVLPVSRFYELKRADSGGENDTTLWTLQVWALPPANVESTSIPVCKIEMAEPKGPKAIPFTQHKLKLERPIEVFWPETWQNWPTFEAATATEASEAQGDQVTTQDVRNVTDVTAAGVEVLNHSMHGLHSVTSSVAMRCRHAMFEGATENGATARSLKHWAELESWFLFGPRYARYDDELLPIDEVTALHPNGEFALTESDLLELRQDDNYIFCHSSVVRFVVLSWGWDVEAGELTKDEVSGQGWMSSGRHAWRLRHLCLSCWLLGQDDLRQTCNDFVMSLGADAPWTEDGFSEALFTLGIQQKAEEFWNSRMPASPGLNEN